MPTRSGYNVRVQNGQVTDVWDTPAPEGQDGWSPAVEITPDLTENREIITTHTIDITKNPIEIIWSKRELTVDERKGSLISQANFAVTMIESQIEMKKDIPDFAGEVATLEEQLPSARTTRDARVAQVEAAVTHEDVDALM
jgi:hypothetical protein